MSVIGRGDMGVALQSRCVYLPEVQSDDPKAAEAVDVRVRAERWVVDLRVLPLPPVGGVIHHAAFPFALRNHTQTNHSPRHGYIK